MDVRICVQNVYDTGEGGWLKVLAGRRCRRVLAGEDVVGVPVLRAAEGMPVLFGLLEADDVQAVEQYLDLVPGVDQVSARQVRLSERRAENPDPSGSGGGMRARSNASPFGSASTARISQP